MRKSIVIVWAALFALNCLSGQAAAVVPKRSVAAAQTFTAGILQVERFGAMGRPPLIIIPGLYCGSWEWNGQLELLSKSHTVFAVTLPGFDGRAAIGNHDLMSRAAQSLDALIRTRRLVRPLIVGHSLGGTLAVYFGERHSNEIGGIIAAEGGYPLAPTQLERNKRVEASVRPYVGIDRRAFGPVLSKAMLQYVITSKADVATVSRLASRSDPTAVVAWMRAALSLDLTPQLSAIRVPLVEIIPFDGAIDPYVGYKTFDAKRRTYASWVAHVPSGGKVIMIDHARHFEMFDQPAKFDQALLAAIAYARKP